MNKDFVSTDDARDVGINLNKYLENEWGKRVPSQPWTDRPYIILNSPQQNGGELCRLIEMHIENRKHLHGGIGIIKFRITNDAYCNCDIHKDSHSTCSLSLITSLLSRPFPFHTSSLRSSFVRSSFLF